ncbi:hypothetical protein DKX38_015267 [Salix brachista]|uniref:Cysteine proteinase inhibitor n=1 Tax=Salix brachista TaxID=2182728 RepID=A0A5N5L4Q8_9ROSI|nr:hypothetical protein DKX38_015267 [Salix brachista]
MYHLTIEAIEAGKKKLYEAKAWVKSWFNFKELHEFKDAGNVSVYTSSDLGVKRDWKIILFSVANLSATDYKFALNMVTYGWIAQWLEVLEEVAGVKLFEPQKFPRLHAWIENFRMSPSARKIFQDMTRYWSTLNLLEVAGSLKAEAATDEEELMVVRQAFSLRVPVLLRVCIGCKFMDGICRTTYKPSGLKGRAEGKGSVCIPLLLSSGATGMDEQGDEAVME